MEYSVVLIIWQCIVTVLCVMFAVRLIKFAKQIDTLFKALFNAANDIDDLRNYITEVRQETKGQIDEINDKYDAAEEMIQQVHKAAEEAELTEKKMQDGITEKLKYSGLRKMQDTFRGKTMTLNEKIWKQYCAGLDFNNKLRLVENVANNENFFIGK